MKKILSALVLAAALFCAAGNIDAQKDIGTAATVTQVTSVATGVTINGSTGVITTFAQSAAAGATATFTVTNDAVRATSPVLLTISSYAGAGTPIVRCTSVANGSFVILITNIHASAALNAAMNISFLVGG